MDGDHSWRAEPGQRLRAAVCLTLVAAYLVGKRPCSPRISAGLPSAFS